jgi:HAD superfamily phosphatase (TIGR01668 family)
MGLFKPTAMKKRITDLSPQLFQKMGVKAVLLDVDNTIASYTSHEPIDGAVQWVRDMVEAGFRVIIVSNNFKKRVAPFAARFGLDCISFAIKPLPFGYIKAAKRLKEKCSQCVIVGDQIFTDVIGANLCGMKSILLTPIEPEEGFTFKIRRFFEKDLRVKYENRKDVMQ